MIDYFRKRESDRDRASKLLPDVFINAKSAARFATRRATGITSRATTMPFFFIP